MTDRTRPIDDYPRLKRAGTLILYSGAVPLAGGLFLVIQAFRGVNPGLAALGAFMLGFTGATTLITSLDEGRI
jgi:hypothetical protein